MKVGFLDKIDPGMQIIALLGDAYEATSSLCLLETLTACHQVHCISFWPHLKWNINHNIEATDTSRMKMHPEQGHSCIHEAMNN